MSEVISKPQAAAAKVNALAALNQALQDAMAEDDKILLIGEDVADPEGGGVVGLTKGLSTRFGETRVRSTPISEQAIMGAVIGASLAGYRPIAEIMLMNFTTVAMDMIVNHAAKLRFMSGGQTSVPIVIRTMTGAGMQTGGQHADFLEAWFAHTPGLKVVAYSNPADAYGLLRSAIEDPDPVVFVESMVGYWAPGDAPEPGSRVPIGKAKVVQEGSDVTILSYARVFNECLAASKALQDAGVSAELIDLRTISPWDVETVCASVAKTGRLLVVHEAVMQFGVGAEIASTVSERLFGKLKAPVARMGAPFAPVPFAPALEAAYVPNAERIAKRAIEIVKGA